MLIVDIRKVNASVKGNYDSSEERVKCFICISSIVLSRANITILIRFALIYIEVGYKSMLSYRNIHQWLDIDWKLSSSCS